MGLNKKIVEVIEKFGFKITEETSEYVTLQQDTPAGEDWDETFWHYGLEREFIHEVSERWNYFDVNEEATFWIGRRGKNGVPSSIAEILEDQKWKLEMLEQLVNALEELELEE